MTERVEQLYREFGPMVYRRCLSVLKDEDAAYDAAQDVFLKIMNSLSVLDRMHSPASYLYRMATNISLNILKKNRVRMMIVPAEDLPDEKEDGLAASMLLEILSLVFSDRTREIVYCRYADNMNLDEIAEHVNLSKSAVRKHLDKFKAHARQQKERIL